MIDVNDLRKGVTFVIDGDLFRVLDYHFNKPGRGNATIKIKARNIRTGSTIDKTFTSGDRVQDANLEFHNVQYLYHDGDIYYFMDLETFEQYPVRQTVIEDIIGFMKENMEVKLTFFNNEPLGVELPVSVELKVVQAEIAVRGDTATSVTKKVKVETGAEIAVPNFVVVGDVIRVDTRTGDYVTRVTS
jgi:elongation factor P